MESGSMSLDEFKKRDAATYDELPVTYVEYVHRISHFIVEEICAQANLQDGERVLDVGSGTGMATVLAAEFIAPSGKAVGIDHSPGLVEMARQMPARGLPVESLPLEYLVMDAEKLEFPDASFDAVISFSAIFHFPNPDRALAEMFRVLRPGGRLILSYTAIRPSDPVPRLFFLLGQLKKKLLNPWQPYLFAPGSLVASASKFLPPLDVAAEPDWSMRNPEKRIATEIEAAGFTGLHSVWSGRHVEFSSPEDFYEAQLMISSDLRTRASRAPEERVNALRKEYVESAREVVRRGGKLLYPFGAVIIKAGKPAR